jgi:hypothetical protein
LSSLLFFTPLCHSQSTFDLSYWKLLLQYEHGFLGGSHSEAHNSEFFISPDGQIDPEAELKASLHVISERQLIQNQPFECIFPGRYHYLKTAFALTQDEQPCPRLQKWKAQFAAQSATVVFATAYLSNVASAFGHVFLKINAKPGFKQKGELLDLGISFAAQDEPGDNPITFAWKGLFGGYLDQYAIMAYFTRLGEYQNIENRDVWEYKLKLNPEQLDRLLDHVWELQNAKISYYFPNRNCAYHLWVLVQVADPNWHMTEPFTRWAMPSDGIKVLVDAGAVSQVKFRPSIYHRLKQKILAMTTDEKAAFDKSKDSEFKLFGDESSLVLEGLLDYQQFTIHPIDRDLSVAEQAKQDEIFTKLSTANISNPQLPPIAAESQPDLGQASKKASFNLGSGHGDHTIGLEFRPTLHDLLDNDEGYTPFSQVEAGRTLIQYSETAHTLDLQSFDLINIISLTPADSVQKSPSWLVRAGALVPPDAACPSCISGTLQGGIGMSTYLLPRTENAIAFAFLKLNLQDGSGTPSSFRFGPSELIGVDLRFSRSIKFLTELEFTQYYDGHWSPNSGNYSQWTNGVAWNVSKNFELRFSGIYYRMPTENYVTASMSAGIYF